ncbi:OLC1v1008254C1 [Oldenlandia corymbosa var. corymbosa]|uniref:OLC1v1008254C1 n=1 Tax=Oldenlandia corymbosa var. corymbosa TaxID=529605 RepID=A0AAV1DL44_OLDCO|nr:OLC1v1008254C1 [Oldenlandia corymbosa var. corymbosa]
MHPAAPYAVLTDANRDSDLSSSKKPDATEVHHPSAAASRQPSQLSPPSNQLCQPFPKPDLRLPVTQPLRRPTLRNRFADPQYPIQMNYILVTLFGSNSVQFSGISLTDLDSPYAH